MHPGKLYVNSSHNSCSGQFEGTKPPTLIWTSSKENDCYSDVYTPDGFCVDHVILTSQWSMQKSYQIFSVAEMQEVIGNFWPLVI